MGEVVLMKNKRDEDIEFTVNPKTKGKKNRKERGGDQAEVGKPIKHNAATFQLFQKLELEAPITTDDIPPLLEKLEAKLAEYNNKVAEWEEQKEELKRKIMSGEDEIAEADGGEAE